MGKFVRGMQAEQVVLLKDNILIRMIDVPYEEGTIIRLGKKDEDKSRDIMKYHGMHPGIVEVVCVSKDVAEKGIDVGDIIMISQRDMFDVARGHIDPVRIDDEVLYLITLNEVQGKMNYYRERVEKGKVTIKK